MTTVDNTPDSGIIASPVDWAAISWRFQKALRDMVHGTPEQQYTGPDGYAEALKRALGYVPAGDTGSADRALPYDRLTHGHGLTTNQAAKHMTDGHTVVDRLNREQAEQQVAEMRAEVARVYREARKDVADYLRERCNERTVPSRYRREGVTWAADMIDPSVPKDRFGNLPADGAR